MTLWLCWIPFAITFASCAWSDERAPRSESSSDGLPVRRICAVTDAIFSCSAFCCCWELASACALTESRNARVTSTASRRASSGDGPSVVTCTSAVFGIAFDETRLCSSPVVREPPSTRGRIWSRKLRSPICVPVTVGRSQ